MASTVATNQSVLTALFVISAAGVLSDFASVLGGTLAGDAAVALSAGCAAAFISGALGFFQAASSRGADRRLALAGLGPARVASSRIAASIGLAVVAAAAAFIALVVRVDVAHPLHAAVAVLAFALLYLAIGIVVGSLITAPLEGSLLVVFMFLLDAFAGPGMTGGSAPPWAVSQKAADILIAAGMGTGSPTGDWVKLVIVTAGALVTAFLVFVFLLDAFAGPGMTGGSAPPWAVSQKAADVLIAAGTGTGSPTADWVSVVLVTGGALVAAFLVFVASARSRA